jgi:hypothetical protein
MLPSPLRGIPVCFVRSAVALLFLATFAVGLAEAQVIYAAHPSIVTNRLILDGSNLDSTASASVGGTSVTVVSVSSSQVVTTLPSPVVDGTYLVQLFGKNGRAIASFSMQFIVNVLPNNLVFGSGPTGTVPVWTGSSTLGASRIVDGSTVQINAPVTVGGKVQALSSTNAVALEGINTGPGAGLFASSVNDTGVIGLSKTATRSGTSGINDNGSGGTGVYGEASSNTPFSWAFGVLGVANGSAGIGVQGSGAFEGVVGITTACSVNGCVPTSGIAGVFTTGVGGTVIQGFEADAQNSWKSVFRVDHAGNLEISGNAVKPGGGSWSTPSDVRLKKSVEPINGALQKMLSLRGVTFEYVDPTAINELSGLRTGMVAQEVERVFPSWVDVGADGYKRLTFRGFEAIAVEAVRELDDKVNGNARDAMSRIAELERQNAELRRAIEALTALVKALDRK